MSIVWPEGEDFTQLVATAMKDRTSRMGARLREKLAEPDTINRTVSALEQIVDNIDEQLEVQGVDPELRARRERARDGMWDWLVLFRTYASIQDADDG